MMNGMRYVTVRSRGTPITGYDSFEAAIRANAVSARGALAKTATDMVRDKAVLSGCWGDDQVSFLLSQRTSLHFFVKDDVIDWVVGSKELYMELTAKLRSDPEVITLTWLFRDGQARINELSRDAIMKRITGRRVSQIVVDEFGVYLYFVKDTRYLSLHAVTALEPERPFMYWFEDQD